MNEERSAGDHAGARLTDAWGRSLPHRCRYRRRQAVRTTPHGNEWTWVQLCLACGAIERPRDPDDQDGRSREGGGSARRGRG